MRVLVGCERSGVVRDMFRALGHDAMSCDTEPTDTPGPHYRGDVRDVIGDGWDIGIFHPPCTYLTRAGRRWLFEDRSAQSAAERYVCMLQACEFFVQLWRAPIPRVAVENPRMHDLARELLGPPTQVVHPWEYGHPEAKATGLWLRGLPPLVAGEDTRAVMEALPKAQAQRVWNMSPGPERARWRSLTYPGIAAAMAAQWGGTVNREAAPA